VALPRTSLSRRVTDVHTTIRSSAREDDVRTMVARRCRGTCERLTFTVADLTSDEGWPEEVGDVT